MPSILMPKRQWNSHHRKQHKHALGVYSEVGKLDVVLMHRPGRELQRLTPANKEVLLFEEIPNINETRKSHDVFTDTLRKQGTTVVYVLDVLRETLEHSSAARQMLVDGVVQHRSLPEEASAALKEWLASLTPSQLAHTVIEGLACTEEELGEGQAASILLRMCSSDDNFLVPPLPNLLFTRDSFSIIEKSVFIWHMSKSARFNEPLIMRVIFSFPTQHAKLSLAGVHVIDWETYADPSATVEGGDVAYLGEGVLMIGNSERTNRAGIEAIERTGLFRQVIAVQLPENRDYMHLDTILCSVGRHTFTLHQHLAEQLPVFTVQTANEGNGEVEWLEHGHDVRRALRHLLADPTLYFYDAADEETSIFEQHECRHNMLCIGDQHVITYEGGDPENGIVGRMRHDSRHPCQVKTFPQRGLIEGFGGAHCMTNALHRLPK